MSETSPRWSRATVILGTLTAFFACLAALGGAFGLSSSQAESDVSGQLDAAQRKAAADARTIESLRTTNNELEGQIASLEAELERAEGPTLAPTPSPKPEMVAEPVRHQGEVTLADGGESIDLNAPPSDQLWRETAPSGEDHIRLREGEIDFSYSNISYLPLEGQQAAYGVCSSSSGYGPVKWTNEGVQGMSPDQLDANKCWRLSSGRYAKIVHKGGGGDRTTLAITTWENE